MKNSKKNKKLNIKGNNGITGIDLVVAIIIITIFIGLLTSLMVGLYKQATDIQKSANAMSYATQILEKVDEKTFEEVKDLNFVENLKNSGEITIPEGYTVTYEVSDLPDVASEVNEVMQKVKVRIDYKILNEEKSMFLMKLKIKEIYKDEG